MAVTESKGDGYALYNGVKLPNIDTVWTDKEKYSHAAIFDGMELPDVNAMVLILSSEAPTYSNGTVATGGRYSVAKLANSEWSILDEGDNSGTNQLIGLPINIAPIAWTSHDIINIDDNSLYLAASAPIPLDGMNVIEWDGDTTGLESGGELYRIGDYSAAVDAIGVLSYEDGDVFVLTDFQNTDIDGKPVWELLVGPNAPTAVLALESEIDGISSGIWCVSLDDGNGNVGSIVIAYTPATTEEPETPAVKKFPLMQFILGLLTELTAGTAKEPIAYLYNGVRLPKLPERDRGSYPFALMCYQYNKYFLYCMDNERKVTKATDGTGSIVIGTIPGPAFVSDGGEWEESTLGAFAAETVWANYDVHFNDSTGGGLCLSASNPVPVYE